MKSGSWLTLCVAFAFCLCFPAAAFSEDGDLLDQAALARQAYDAGQWEDALQRYARLAEKAPGNAEIRFRLGNVYARLGRLEEAAASYQNLLARQPATPKGWHNLAVVQLRQAMAALSEAERQGAPQEALPSRRLLDALETTMGDREKPAPECPAAIEPPAVEPPAPKPLAAYTASRVNLRQGHGPGHPKVATLPADALVEVLSQQENHAQVKTRDGQTGWLPLYLLRLGPVAGNPNER